MAWMLITLTLACIVYTAKIVMDYTARRDQCRVAIRMLEQREAEIEHRQQIETAHRDRIREGLPELQASMDGLSQRLIELRSTYDAEQDRQRRLEIAAYKMQIKMSRSR